MSYKEYYAFDDFKCNNCGRWIRQGDKYDYYFGSAVCVDCKYDLENADEEIERWEDWRNDL